MKKYQLALTEEGRKEADVLRQAQRDRDELPESLLSLALGMPRCLPPLASYGHAWCPLLQSSVWCWHCDWASVPAATHSCVQETGLPRHWLVVKRQTL